MKWIVYQTTNLVNKKIYIGVHHECINEKSCTYLGSGYRLDYAVRKYGLKNFKRITLYSFDNIIDAFIKERELVNIEFVKNDNTYNITVGGRRGGYITEETKSKISKTLKGRKLTNEHKRNISIAEKLRGPTPKMLEQLERLRRYNTGQKRTPEQVGRIMNGRGFEGWKYDNDSR